MKFIVMRKDKNKLLCIGGEWNKEKDGGDPSVDKSVIIKTAIRSLLELTQIDLSDCKQWFEFAEIHYQRANHREISSIYMPNLSYLVDCSQSLELLPLKTNANSSTPSSTLPDNEENEIHIDDNHSSPQQGDVETEVFETGTVPFFDNGNSNTEGDIVPDIPLSLEKKTKENTNSGATQSNDKLSERSDKPLKGSSDQFSAYPKLQLTVPCPKDVKLTLLPLSLNGLLEYDEFDTDEKTFEVSLFAELFNDMLQRDFSNLIFQALELFSKNNSVSTGESPLKKLKLEKASADFFDTSTTSEDDSLEDLVYIIPIQY